MSERQWRAVQWLDQRFFVGSIRSVDSGLVHSVTGTAANVTEKRGQLKKMEAGPRKDLMTQRERAKAQIRSKAGKSAMEDLEPADINRRVNQGSVMNYAELYPCIDEGCLLHTNCAPSTWASDWHQVTTDHWRHP